MAKRDSIVKLLQKLLVAFATKMEKLADEEKILIVSVYIEELEDLPFEALRWAISQSIRTSEWFPTVATIRNLTYSWLKKNFPPVEFVYKDIYLILDGRQPCYEITLSIVPTREAAESLLSKGVKAAKQFFVEAYERILSSRLGDLGYLLLPEFTAA
jgi:hypothetical protein